MITEKFKLKHIANVTAGNAAPSKDDFVSEGTPFIRAGSLAFLTTGDSIDMCEKIDKQLATTNKLKLFPKDSILFAKSGMSAKMGRVYQLPIDAYVASHLAVIQPNIKLANPSFIKYFFYYRPPFHLIRDDAYPSIKLADIEEIEIDLPDLQTQNKIATILDQSRAIESKRLKTIQTLDELPKAMFVEMFGDPVKSKKVTERIQLKNLGIWKSGGTPSRVNPDYFTGNIPWVTSGELNDIFLSSAEEQISQQAVEDSSAKLIEVGSLLLGMYDTAALKSSITTTKMTCNQAIAYSKLDDQKCDVKFVYYNIQLAKDYFRNQQRGARQQNMNLSMIRNIEILFPQLQDQRKFSAIVDKYYAQRQLLLASQADISTLASSILQRVFNGQLNFNIDFELDALIGEVNLVQKENDLSTIEGDISYLQRLIDKLNGQEFAEKELYDKAKHAIFQLMSGEDAKRKVTQDYDENSKRIKLVLA